MPVFHRALIHASGLKPPLAIVNVGGIANVTFIDSGNRLYAAIAPFPREIAGDGDPLRGHWLLFRLRQVRGLFRRWLRRGLRRGNILQTGNGNRRGRPRYKRRSSGRRWRAANSSRCVEGSPSRGSGYRSSHWRCGTPSTGGCRRGGKARASDELLQLPALCRRLRATATSYELLLLAQRAQSGRSVVSCQLSVVNRFPIP